MNSAKKRERDLALGLPVDPPKPVTCQVRCNGRMHRIEFDGEHLHLLDHPHLEREKVLREFGNKCRCLDVLDAWANCHPRLRPALQKGRIPAPLREPFLAWREARLKARYTARQMPDLQNSLDKAAHDRTVQAVKSSLRKSYWWLYSQINLNPVSGCIGTIPDAYRQGKVLHVDVRDNWYRNVYRQGLAVIAHQFILDVLTEEDARRYRGGRGCYSVYDWVHLAESDWRDLNLVDRPCVLVPVYLPRRQIVLRLAQVVQGSLSYQAFSMCFRRPRY